MSSSTFALSNHRLFATALVLAVAPLWFGRYLPMVDLPQHAAQVAAIRELLASNLQFSAVFEINWFTPYLLGYLLLYLLAALLPISIATKVLVSASMISVPILTGALLREVGADTRWRWLAIPGCYSVSFYWGFISYMVAVPIALLLLIQTVRFDRKPTPMRGALLAASSLFLLFCHVIALSFAGLAAASFIAGKHYRDIRALALRWIPLAVPLPLIAAWLVLTYNAEGSVQNAPVVYGPLLNRLFALLTQPSGIEHLTVFGTVVTTAIAVLPPLTGARLTSDAARWLPFSVGLLAFLVVPSFAFNTAFLYERLGVFLVPLWLMVWDPPNSGSHRFEFLGMILIIAWIALNTARFASFARETQPFDRIMAAMEPGQYAAMLVVDNRSPLFATPVYLHFPAWYQATKHGIADFNFADFPLIVRYRQDRGPRVREQLAWAPWRFQWDRDGGSTYRYFVVKSDVDVAPVLFKEKEDSVALVARSEWWWLYENLELK